MPCCRSLQSIALGGCIIACVLLVPLTLQAQQKAPVERAPAVSAGTEGETHPAIQDDDTGSAPEETEAPTSDAESRVSDSVNPKPDHLDTAKNDTNSQDEANDIARRDLAAQQNMAESTFDLVEMAWWQIVIAVVAAILLGFTLFYTRRAVHEAGKGTQAAQESTRVAREIGEAQTRAYMSIPNASTCLD